MKFNRAIIICDRIDLNGPGCWSSKFVNRSLAHGLGLNSQLHYFPNRYQNYNNLNLNKRTKNIDRSNIFRRKYASSSAVEPILKSDKVRLSFLKLIFYISFIFIFIFTFCFIIFNRIRIHGWETERPWGGGTLTKIKESTWYSLPLFFLTSLAFLSALFSLLI